MPKLLALDIATRTGWAFGPIGEAPETGAISFSEISANSKFDERVWNAAVRWLYPQLLEWKPDHVAVEAPIMTASPTGGSNTATMQRLVGLQAVMRQAIYAATGSAPAIVHVSSARKFFIGKGNLRSEQAKPLVHKRCQQAGWRKDKPIDYDESDACCIWAYAAGHIDPSFAANFTPLGARS